MYQSTETTFNFLKLLGRGSFGSVYKVSTLATDKIRALKILTQPTKEIRERFITEAELLVRASQPPNRTGWCIVYAVGIFRNSFEPELPDENETFQIYENDPYIEMEFVDGVNLEECIQEKNGSDIRGLLEIALKVAAGLEQLHCGGEQPIAHRDLKPLNIMIEKGTGAVKIVDLGGGKAIDLKASETTMTTDGGVSAPNFTPLYASPEQAKASLDSGGEEQTKAPSISCASDIFSFGSILFRIARNCLPFEAETMPILLDLIASLPEEPAKKLEGTTHPMRLCKLIKNMHKANPKNRISAPEVHTELKQVVEHYKESLRVTLE